MLRILIVEDEDKIRKLHAELLESEGYQVVSVPDAVEASEILLRKHFDIILLDINLPRVYGSILFDLIRAFSKSIKVIVTSVYPVEEQRRIMKDAFDYYDKAQGVDVLLEKVKKAARGILPLSTILIVEDEFKIRRLFSGQLEDLGYRTLEAEDGELGLELFAKEPDIGLVILDIALPGRIGMKVYEGIKGRNTPVKVIVSSVFPAEDQRSLIPGADEYFDKAEGVDILIEKVERLLNSGK
ncbi:MAG TPA: response regulator [Candidatus Omnitrophota bacterium]|jgi:CheY-like chemotaxis protein|nr:response regulator [Candidatus Omnitrophota bacterium]HSA30758.1 response regulator [Candidatus Omnitrophota bacterium]